MMMPSVESKLNRIDGLLNVVRKYGVFNMCLSKAEIGTMTAPARMTESARIEAWRRCAMSTAFASLIATAATADTGPAFSLHLSGQDAPAMVDLQDMAELPRSQITTSTVWTQTTDVYDGVMLLDLLMRNGIDPSRASGTVTIEAIDGYSAKLDFTMIGPDAPMIADHRNGAPMPLREQGPFWLIFPYDDDGVYRQESIYAMSVWQINSIRVDY